MHETLALPDLAGLQAVIFDFDGVVLESADLKTQAFLEVFADVPEHREAILEHHLAHLGFSRFEKFRWIYRNLLERPLGEAEEEALGERYAEVVRRKILACPFVPGALELLQGLGDKAAFVASGTPQDELRWVVGERGLEPYFDEVWGSPTHKPEIIEGILARKGYARNRVLMLGDGESDYRAAQATDILFVARESSHTGQSWQNVSVPVVQDLLPLARQLAEA